MNTRMIVFAAAGVAAVVAAVLAFSGVGTKDAQPGQAARPEVAEGVDAGVLDKLAVVGPLGDRALGSANAPVTLIEYSSATCPHCASFHKDTLPTLKTKYIATGQVRYILREFPIDRLAAAASMLARCLPADRYFSFFEVVYQRQEDWAFGQGEPIDRLFRLAQQAGFTKASFDQCLSDQKILDGLNWGKEHAGKELGVRSTPTFFVNGQLVRGAQPLAKFEELFAPFLKQQGS